MQRNLYKNPLGITNIGDPFVLKASDGKYYCYPTSSDEGYKVWSSSDMINWSEEGFVYKKEENSWCVSHFWAPEVVEYHGRFYMYFSAMWKEKNSLRIGVAVSDNPLGPFKDISNCPMFDLGYAAIDAHVFIDDDLRRYLYFSRDCSENIYDGRHESHIYGVELNDDMFTLKGEPILLLKPEQPWESESNPEWRWNEGPFVLKNRALYYLMYSANFFANREYSVGYAVSDRPLGRYEKYSQNPVLFAGNFDVSGPGHHSVTTSPDGTEMFIFYHTHTDPAKGGGNRQVCMDRMSFREDGTIYIEGPTLTERPVPSSSRLEIIAEN